MKKIFLILFILVCSAVFTSHAAEILDFAKKKNFYLGEGEYGAISLKVNKFESYNYQSERKNGFTLKKMNDGLIEIIFDISTVSGDLAEGKTYSAAFNFTKKDIGKTDKLNVSAVYKPELRVVLNDTLRANNARLSFSPDKLTETIRVEALKNINGLKIDDANSVLKLNGGKPLSFKKGMNDLEITLAKAENLSEEILIFKSASGGNIDELYLLVTASKFNSGAPAVKITETAKPDTASSDTTSAVIPASTVTETAVPEEDPPVQSGGMGILPVIIMSVMGIVILLLLFLLMSNKKGAMFNKYESFFNDIATLVKVDPKSGNIDKTIEEIMMTLLEKFETTPDKKEKTDTDGKRTLKKPSNLKSPAVTQPKDNDNIELNFGSDEEIKNISPSDSPLDPKPVTPGEKKISRGFDFLEEDN